MSDEITTVILFLSILSLSVSFSLFQSLSVSFSLFQSLFHSLLPIPRLIQFKGVGNAWFLKENMSEKEESSSPKSIRNGAISPLRKRLAEQEKLEENVPPKSSPISSTKTRNTSHFGSSIISFLRPQKETKHSSAPREYNSSFAPFSFSSKSSLFGSNSLDSFNLDLSLENSNERILKFKLFIPETNLFRYLKVPISMTTQDLIRKLVKNNLFGNAYEKIQEEKIDASTFILLFNESEQSSSQENLLKLQTLSIPHPNFSLVSQNFREIDLSQTLETLEQAENNLIFLFQRSNLSKFVFSETDHSQNTKPESTLIKQESKLNNSPIIEHYEEMDFWDEVGREDTIRYTWDNKSNRNIVSAATLNKLVEKLTADDAHDLEFTQIFLLTYQSFTTPKKLLSKLIQRYLIPVRANLDEKSIQTIQLRVCNVIQKWIELSFFDFDEESTKMLNEFISSIMLPDLGKRLNKAIQNQNMAKKAIKKQFTSTPPSSNVPRNLYSNDLKFIDVDDLEIARQLTLIEFKFFSKIKPKELLNKNWNTPERQHLSPNVVKIIKRFNIVSLWVVGMILQSPDLKSRLKMITKCINIAKCLYSLNNFSTMTAFIAAFNNSSLSRLSVMKALPVKLQEDLDMLENIMNSEQSYKTYRSTLHSCNPPLIPYLGVYLSDLIFIEDGNPDNIGPLINFEKRRLESSVIIEIQIYQQNAYNLQRIPKIASLLKKLPEYNEKELYQQSLICEPRKNT